MLYLGDIQKINGDTVPIVDVVVGGSPCQDLSVAGKRAGLDGERSGLFMEQLRIIKEMREHDGQNGRTDEHIRPRYMVWENVPGAFSSNKAEDFRIVLEETAKVIDKDASIPMPDNGKWTTAGCILGNGWSIAWRVCDAQFYGVPQRRRRIALIADFGGHSAPEILFVRKSVSRDTESSKPKGKETPTDASRSIGADDIFCIDGDKLNKKERKGGSGIGYRDGDKQYTLTAKDVHGVAYCFEPGAAKRLGGYVWEDLAPTLRTEVGDNRPSVAYTLQDREGKAGGGKGALIAEEMSATLRANNAQYLFQPVQCIDQGGGKSACNVQEGQAPTLTCTHGGEPAVVYAMDRVSFNQGKNAQYDFEVSDKGVNSPLVAKGPSAVCYSTNHGSFHTQVEEGICATLQASDYKDPPIAYYNADLPIGVAMQSSAGIGSAVTNKIPTLINGDNPGWQVGVCHAVDCHNGTEDIFNGALQSNMAHSLNGNNVVRTRYIVRRLTPLECERLQGYPDGWTDIGEWTDSKGKVHKTSDAARYKALGNSIALPPWKWVMKRLCACYERDATLASLFDGIGGFPLIWEQLNGKGSCLWASEIEDFPIAVTKARIGE